MKRAENLIYFEDGGDIQATGEPVDCRSLTSPPPLDSSKLYIMNEFSQWINNATSSLKSSPLIFECIRVAKTTTFNENFWDCLRPKVPCKQWDSFIATSWWISSTTCAFCVVDWSCQAQARLSVSYRWWGSHRSEIFLIKNFYHHENNFSELLIRSLERLKKQAIVNS